SRYYIPEMLLTLLTSAAIVCGYRYARSGKSAWAVAAGACAGLMFITKETAVIPAACMLMAFAVVSPRPSFRIRHLASGVAAAVLIPAAAIGFRNGWHAAMFYSQRAIHPAAHSHSPQYYLSLLLWSHAAGGPVWTEGLIVVLAAIGLAIAFRWKTP